MDISTCSQTKRMTDKYTFRITGYKRLIKHYIELAKKEPDKKPMYLLLVKHCRKRIALYRNIIAAILSRLG